MTRQPTYAQSLREMMRTEPRSKLLSAFWNRPSRWPKGDSDWIFLGEAVQHVGRQKFGELWTGNEIDAHRRMSDLPPFSGTLEYHWEKVRETLPVDTFQPSPLASWDGPVPPPFLVPTPISPAHLKVSLKARARRLEEEGAKFRPIYDRALADWKKLQQENRPARERLEWVMDWIATEGRLGKLETRLRRVKTDNGGGDYIEAPEGFWNSESSFSSRFYAGSVDYRIDGKKSKRFYILFTRISLDRCLGDLAPFQTPAEWGDLHLSQFMRAIIDAIRELNITAKNQLTIGEIAAHLIKNWKGDEPLSLKMANRMASVLRDVESQRGAWKHVQNG